jgi:hypothetical protein
MRACWWSLVRLVVLPACLPLGSGMHEAYNGRPPRPGRPLVMAATRVTMPCLVGPSCMEAWRHNGNAVAGFMNSCT